MAQEFKIIESNTLAKKYPIYTGKNRFDTNWKQDEKTWEEIIKQLSIPMIQKYTLDEFRAMKKEDANKATNLKDKGGFVAGVFEGSDGRRREQYMTSRSMVALDIESVLNKKTGNISKVPTDIIEKIECFKYECFYHTTHGHSDEDPRIRIIFPLYKNVTPDEYRHISQNLARELKVLSITDEASFKANQLMYYPVVPKDSNFQCGHIKGKLVTGNKLLNDNVEKKITNLQSPLEVEGIIGKFCTKYNVEECIEEFLDEIYEQGTIANKYTYLKSDSGSPNGAQVYSDNEGNDSQFLFCRNHSDPCNDNHCHNSFDLIKHHLCKGNAQNAVKKAMELMGYEPSEDDEEWDANFIKVDKKGNVTPKMSKFNFRRALKLDDINEIRYNEMISEIEINNKEINFDTEIANLKDSCNKHSMIGVSTGSIREYTVNLAHENRYHPVKDYLDSVKPKEGLIHFNELIDNVFKYRTPENAEFYKILLKKWLLSGIAAIYDDNFSSDGFIVLQGSQGMGKSSFFREICPVKNAFRGEVSNFDPKDKDSVRLVTKYWITELAEIKGTFKKDRDNLKGFITSSYDEYRRAFHMSDTKKKRQTIFGGSVNDEQFLKDETGDRRFWVIPIEEINWEFIRDSVNINGLWGEIKNLYKKGASYRLTGDERNVLNTLNLEFKVKTNIESQILSFIDDSEKATVKFYTMDDLFTYFSDVARIGKNEKLTEINIGKALSNAGYKRKQKRINKKPKRGYEIPLKANAIFN